MVSAVISVICGVLTFFGAPIVIPIVGIALGINAHLKEKKKETPDKKIINMATAGIVLNICGSIFMIILTPGRAL